MKTPLTPVQPLSPAVHVQKNLSNISVLQIELTECPSNRTAAITARSLTRIGCSLPICPLASGRTPGNRGHRQARSLRTQHQRPNGDAHRFEIAEQSSLVL